jgi:hypothetical protein
MFLSNRHLGLNGPADEGGPSSQNGGDILRRHFGGISTTTTNKEKRISILDNLHKT